MIMMQYLYNNWIDIAQLIVNSAIAILAIVATVKLTKWQSLDMRLYQYRPFLSAAIFNDLKFYTENNLRERYHRFILRDETVNKIHNLIENGKTEYKNINNFKYIRIYNVSNNDAFGYKITVNIDGMQVTDATSTWFRMNEEFLILIPPKFDESGKLDIESKDGKIYVKYDFEKIAVQIHYSSTANEEFTYNYTYSSISENGIHGVHEYECRYKEKKYKCKHKEKKEGKITFSGNMKSDGKRRFHIYNGKKM